MACIFGKRVPVIVYKRMLITDYGVADLKDFALSVGTWLAGILASLIVVYLTQFINSKYFAVRNELKDYIKKTNCVLGYYKNIIMNPGCANQELEREASNEIRRIAMELDAFAEMYPKLRYLKFDSIKLKQLSSNLIGLSNSLFDTRVLKNNQKRMDEIEQLLKK